MSAFYPCLLSLCVDSLSHTDPLLVRLQGAAHNLLGNGVDNEEPKPVIAKPEASNRERSHRACRSSLATLQLPDMVVGSAGATTRLSAETQGSQW